MTVKKFNEGTVETVKGMCADARREINHLELALLEAVNQTMKKLLLQSEELNSSIFRNNMDISDSHRRQFEKNCFNGLRSIKKCLSSIQDEFETKVASKTV